ncbi:hypothetical protein C5F49_05130 [Nitrosopumilus oxyclinae]|uniref:Uncharacterized protein n=1 Tax=Nitrosopumilus oxyclinae TaxID=1959104 RepID=A0A7D5R8F3_9ARCH|nr:hypothetical protein [Nitrosopumilus oxyclinae]QLH04764.1 hypothetical protein C5F49_05130 [Nitrosopumilus oxyclinae]
MSLEDEIKIILDDFEQAKSESIIHILNQIKPHFKSGLISEYLQGKIQKIQDVDNEQDKKKQCKALLPYFDWYLQGL